MAKAKKKKSRLPVIVFLSLVALGAVFMFLVFGPNAGRDRFIYIKNGSTYDQLLQHIKDSGYVRDAATFNLVAKQWQLPDNIHPGKYQVKRGMSIFSLVKKLRYGRQTPVRIVINKLRTKADFIDLLANNLNIDGEQLADMLQQPQYMAEFGLDTNTVMCAVIPDTYEFYWNTTCDKVFRKIQKNYTRFWTGHRMEQAKKHGLTPTQAAIVASIIEEETNRSEDKPKIASVYLNRIDKGMKLQADPTVKFAIGDFTIRRVTGVMLRTESPYNTYYVAGLPPGPICTPSPATVDAVLQAPKTDYIYFCAKADLSGASVFAATGEEHIKNARAYQQALNARGIH
ncbi:MAG: endolytic transglycosylase MltG [Taibaiella sp.]|nr:endolytic transglycosylase MltG [Taibaiella sp.]